MGGGASRRALHQRSDSRLEAILAESRKNADNANAFALPLGKASVLRVEVGSLKRPVSGRAQMYSGQRWCQERTSSLHEFDLPVSEDVASREQRASKEEEEEEEEEDGYSTDDFEDDEIMEWKKGGSIGAGSYGTVYLARDEETGSLMAVKEILISEESEVDIHEATREVELLRGLRHEHIVKYLGCHIDNEAQTLSIFTEWVPGGSLEHNRKLFGGNERVVRRFTHQLLSGVAYLHSKNIIHQDIKPSNILVDQYGVVKLADFGASRLISSATMSASSPSSSRSLRGTPNYMAPEVIKQTVGRSRKADVWSIGCSVLRLLTGRALWGDQRFNSQAALLYYIANLEVLPPLPDSLSPEAHRFISACLQIDPAKRPTAAKLLEFPFVQVAGLKVDLSVLQPVDTPRRNTAPATSSPMRDLAAQGCKQEQQQQAESVKGGGASSTTKCASLVATLFTPRGGGSTPNVAPEQELEGNDVHGVVGRNLSSAATQEENNHDVSPTNWEEQPISTAVANVEREKRHAQAVEAERRRLEREKEFQEELARYRREAFAGRS